MANPPVQPLSGGTSSQIDSNNNAADPFGQVIRADNQHQLQQEEAKLSFGAFTRTNGHTKPSTAQQAIEDPLAEEVNKLEFEENKRENSFEIIHEPKVLPKLDSFTSNEHLMAKLNSVPLIGNLQSQPTNSSHFAIDDNPVNRMDSSAFASELSNILYTANQ